MSGDHATGDTGDSGAGDGDGSETSETAVRVRGIYATALTDLFRATEATTVVDASPAIDRRFDADFPARPADAAVETTDDRTGVGVSGSDAAVDRVADRLGAVGRDVLVLPDPAPAEAVFEAPVVDTRGGGAIVELGDRQGYLPFDAVDGYVEVGDRLRVAVRDPAPPWADRRPRLDSRPRVGGSFVGLDRGESGVSAAADRERTRELARTTEMLPVEVPDGWGVYWRRPAVEADLSVEAMSTALSAAADRARAVDRALSGALSGDGVRSGDGASSAGGGSASGGDAGDRDPGGSDGTDARRLVAPAAGAWVWFGRESRFALDDRRRSVTDTMAGHHRTKAGGDGAGDAVDFVEAVCGGVDSFPFEAVLDQFGPAVGDQVRIAHGKPDGRLVDLGPAEVVDRDDGSRKLEVRREMQSAGTYDGLGTPREAGDVAVTRLVEGRWWYPTAYRGADGDYRGTYVNVCTPVELFPEAARYVDLHVDVVRRPDGSVDRVDDDELDAAVEADRLSPALARKAREVADAVLDAFGS